MELADLLLAGCVVAAFEVVLDRARAEWLDEAESPDPESAEVESALATPAGSDAQTPTVTAPAPSQIAILP